MYGNYNYSKRHENYQFELFGIVEPDTGLHPGLDVRRLQLLRIVAPPEQEAMLSTI